jgi:hypothetical protein
MGPLNTPWFTFCAWCVALGCVIFSIVWAFFIYRPSEDGDE